MKVNDEKINYLKRKMPISKGFENITRAMKQFVFAK